MEIDSCRPSGARNFEVTPGFLKICVYCTAELQIQPTGGPHHY